MRLHPVLVATLPGEARAAGFGALGPFRTGGGYAGTVEHTLHVRADRRRLGLGTLILDGLAAAARAAGHRRMVGAISADQAASLALHRRAGFAEVGRLDGVGRKFGRDLDLVLVMRAP